MARRIDRGIGEVGGGEPERGASDRTRRERRTKNGESRGANRQRRAKGTKMAESHRKRSRGRGVELR